MLAGGRLLLQGEVWVAAEEWRAGKAEFSERLYDDGDGEVCVRG